jgi:hypothetical protein
LIDHALEHERLDRVQHGRAERERDDAHDAPRVWAKVR